MKKEKNVVPYFLSVCVGMWTGISVECFMNNMREIFIRDEPVENNTGASCVKRKSFLSSVMFTIELSLLIKKSFENIIKNS